LLTAVRSLLGAKQRAKIERKFILLTRTTGMMSLPSWSSKPTLVVDQRNLPMRQKRSNPSEQGVVQSRRHSQYKQSQTRQQQSSNTDLRLFVSRSVVQHGMRSRRRLKAMGLQRPSPPHLARGMNIMRTPYSGELTAMATALSRLPTLRYREIFN
jgi:hypothetical protein